MSYKETLVVNLYGAPSSGKSTLSARLFYELKKRQVSCELVTEYAKDLVWEDREETFKNEVYLFAKQHHRLFRVNGKVDVIVTDRPILLSKYYNSRYGGGRFTKLDDLVLEQYCSMRNLDVFINRSFKYEEEGRNESEKEAQEIEVEMRNMLQEDTRNLLVIKPTEQAIQDVISVILSIQEDGEYGDEYV